MQQHEKDIKACAISKEPLSCAKKVISEYKGNCRPRLILLVQDNCDPCKEAQAKFAKDIDDGIISKVHIDSKEGISIIKNNGIDNVPTLLALDCHNKVIAV